MKPISKASRNGTLYASQRQLKRSWNTQGGRIALIAICVLLVLAVWGILSRIHSDHTLKQDTQAQSIPVVTVLTVENGNRAPRQIDLPATMRAWNDAPVYARVSGYLKNWQHDIGDIVHAGDVLAEIDTPDTDAQLRQAKADLQVAIANNQLAQSTAVRWIALRKVDAVSPQAADEKIGDARAKAASELSARANLARLNDLVGFKKLVAPFDGVVTARNTDVGALVEVGGSTAQPLFRVASLNKLRVYVNVPETQADLITPEVIAQAYVKSQPGAPLPLHYLSSAGVFDPSSRTMLVQFQLDNADQNLAAGGYAQVRLSNPSASTVIPRLPVNAFLFQSQGLQLATVDNGNHVHMRKVQPGQDFGKELEVVSGVSFGERVILNPPDSLYEGQEVRIAPQAPTDGGKEQQKAQNEKAQSPTEKGQGDNAEKGGSSTKPSREQEKDSGKLDAEKSKSGQQ